VTHGIIRNTLLQFNKVMRNKKLVQNRLSTLQGQLKKLDMQIHRGGDRVTINEAQRAVEETVQDIIDIVEREA
jgi:DNA-binding FrmR family transcriptional regulator